MDQKCLHLEEECSINKNDTFRLRFPDDDEFLEINFCSDSMCLLNNIMQGIRKGSHKENFY